MNCVKSVLVTHFGGYDALVVKDYPLTKLKDNEVRVQVHYCGLNFADIYTRLGLMPKEKMPFILGIECSGIISAMGEKTTDRLKIGDRVVCYDYNGGLFRNKICINENKCFKIPSYVNLKEAASLFVNYLTAYFCLFELGNLKENHKILIQSCAGGVGWAATQLAKLTEDVVIYGTTSPFKASAVTQNGVNHVLHYNSYKSIIDDSIGSDLDLIIDNQAGENFSTNLKLLKPLGRLILIGANNLITNENSLNNEALAKNETNLSSSQLFVNSVGVFGLHLGIIAEKNPQLIQEYFEKICALIPQRRINLRIDSMWRIEDIFDATKRLQERQNIGKVLLYTANANANEVIIDF